MNKKHKINEKGGVFGVKYREKVAQVQVQNAPPSSLIGGFSKIKLPIPLTCLAKIYTLKENWKNIGTPQP